MSKYDSVLSLARQLSAFTVNLKPPAFLPADDALEVVQRVLDASFLPIPLIDGAEEHAFFATCASLIAARTRGIALESSHLTRIYRAALKGKHATLDQEEAAFLRSLGVGGVHIFDSEDLGKGEEHG